MTLIGCWRFTGTPTKNGVVTVGNNETTPLRPDSLLCEITMSSESRISEINAVGDAPCFLKWLSTTALGLLVFKVDQRLTIMV